MMGFVSPVDKTTCRTRVSTVEAPKLLILNKAKSDLDSHLEVEDADRVYTIDDGRITETGSHERLIENGG